MTQETLPAVKKTRARKPPAAALAPMPTAADPVAALNYIMQSGGTPEMVKQAMELCNQWQDRRAAEIYGDAIAGFQADMPPVTKGRSVMNKPEKGGGLRYRFASIDDVDKVARPILAKYKLSVSGTINVGETAILVRWTIQCGAHKEYRDFALPKIAATGIAQGVNPVQDMGAWMSYLRRYTYTMALNIVVEDEDTDGNLIRDVLLLDEEQHKFITDCIATGIVRSDGTPVKLTPEGVLQFVQGDLPEAERSIERMTQAQFAKFIGAFKLKYTGKGGKA
jgi:hypothetical protein